MTKNHLKKLNNELKSAKTSPAFIMSSLAFFALLWIPVPAICIGITIAFVIAIFYSGRIEVEACRKLKIFSLLTAVGILGSNFRHTTAYYDLFLDISWVKVLYISLSIGAIYFVYKLLLYFYVQFYDAVKDIKISRKEIAIYGLIAVVMCIATTVTFLKTNAFYGTGIFDVIYTSDSSEIVTYNAYSNIYSFENDLRQPLFALFAAPFTGIFQLAGLLLPKPLEISIINYSQIILLISANIILATAMGLDRARRACFTALSSCTYMFYLFSFMMEQYIVVYLWTVMLVYTYAKDKKTDLPLYAATGSLITNAVFIPFSAEAGNLKARARECFKKCMIFLGLLLASGRADLLGSAKASSDLYTKFIDFWGIDNIRQYTCFVKNIFIAPNASPVLIATGGETTKHASWQLDPATFNIIGIALFILALISLAINRKDKLNKLCGAWILYSLIITVGFGWGAKENGLILYSLYFGWPFILLLFRLLEKIEDKTHCKAVLPVIVIICCASMLLLNIPAIGEMIAFAIKNYPL